MEARHLKPHAQRLTAAARALEAAVAADDPELIAAAHAAVGRVRERVAPRVADLMRAHDRRTAVDRPRAVA